MLTDDELRKLREDPEFGGVANSTGVRWATDPQMRYVNGLLEELGQPADQTVRFGQMLADNGTVRLTFDQAQSFINELKALRTQRVLSRGVDRSKPIPDVPDGRYAVKDQEGQLKFYRVWKPMQGKWAGWTFLAVYSSDDEYPIKNPNTKRFILEQIAVDPALSARMYGRHYKRCSDCNKGLTNRVSRLLDIGPVCGGHHYNPEIWKSIKSEARGLLEAAGLDPDTDVEDTDDLDAIRMRLTR